MQLPQMLPHSHSKEDIQASYSLIPSESFIIHIKFTLFHFFHKVFKVSDNNKTHISWGCLKKINQEDEVLFGREITCNKCTIELLTQDFRNKIKMENMIVQGSQTSA